MVFKNNYNAKRIRDVNGRMTTVYTRPEIQDSIHRLQTIMPPRSLTQSAHELADYVNGNYLSIKNVNNENELNTAIRESDSTETCLFMVTDSVLGSDGEITVEGENKTLMIHLDTLRQARLNIESGTVIIKTYNERYTPIIVAKDSSDVTIIISEHCGVDVIVNDQSLSKIIPEDGAFGTIHVKGSHPVQIHDEHIRHSLLVID